jgi:hypothetical protein
MGSWPSPKREAIAEEAHGGLKSYVQALFLGLTVVGQNCIAVSQFGTYLRKHRGEAKFSLKKGKGLCNI